MSAYSLFIQSLWPRDLNYFTLIQSVILTPSLCGSCFSDERCKNLLQFTQQVSSWDGKLDQTQDLWFQAQHVWSLKYAVFLSHFLPFSSLPHPLWQKKCQAHSKRIRSFKKLETVVPLGIELWILGLGWKEAAEDRCSQHVK